MTRLEKALQDPIIRKFIPELLCPCVFEDMRAAVCPFNEYGVQVEDCEACWNMEYTEKDGEINDNQ